MFVEAIYFLFVLLEKVKEARLADTRMREFGGLEQIDVVYIIHAAKYSPTWILLVYSDATRRTMLAFLEPCLNAKGTKRMQIRANAWLFNFVYINKELQS